jgi:two-component system, NtrC family, sensor kinase
MTGSVLIVDDSLTVRMDLLEAFENGGFHAIPCATLTEARQILARDPVNIVVLDVLLPDGDGVDLLTELRAAADHKCTTVLMLSTEAEVEDRVRGLRTGADEYIGKPYDADHVVATAHRLMRRTTSAAGTPTVLLIDDSVTARTELRRQLEQHAYAVVTAGNGEEGLCLAGDLHPDAIVVDDALPGIDGATLIRRVRLDAALRDVPCLLLTASTDRDTEIRVLDAGADANVGKDEDPSVVLAALAAVLRRTRVSAGAGGAGGAGNRYGPKKVLAVDDSTTYLQAITGSLRADGYEVVLAQSGEQALELLAEQTVDCILLDLLMPGLNGRETCERIKSAAPAVREIPLIMMTALDDADAMLQGLRVGADDYIRKPDDLEVLKARVRAQIRRKHFQDENRRIREELYRKEMEAAGARAARELAETRAELVDELKWRNQELEAFSYSVSHDLRSPLQAVTGFSEVLLGHYAGAMDDEAREMVERIHVAACRMSDLVVALLQLSHASRGALAIEPVDFTAMCEQVADDLRRSEPDRSVRVTIAKGIQARADPSLLRVLVENLLGNAWKFTRRTEAATIEVGQHDGGVYYVRDNGAGFPAGDAMRLFEPFRRLHSDADFPGTGIGLATVHRIVDRHAGRIWVAGDVGRGATFHFTLDGSGPQFAANSS